MEKMNISEVTKRISFPLTVRSGNPILTLPGSGRLISQFITNNLANKDDKQARLIEVNVDGARQAVRIRPETRGIYPSGHCREGARRRESREIDRLLDPRLREDD